MKAPSESLHAGLLDLAEKNSSVCAGSMPWMLGWLEHLVGDLIEGNAQRKKNARADLKKLVGRGRCILNAADFNAGLAKGHAQAAAEAQESMLCLCGEPLRRRPCNCTAMAVEDDCPPLPTSKGGAS